MQDVNRKVSEISKVDEVLVMTIDITSHQKAGVIMLVATLFTHVVLF
tara:strand:- start:1850 stop:1990 length:141 start_codon:yes stop_codon:yes gene_type:complete